ncbi:MAG: APC family permease [Gemmatimonadetes bacterium]|nr:MAG: APC family permease [Gemmatimonadota bacterium]HMC54133.1 APC family permease [Gemmatimonadaceae bacterium]
MTVSASAAEVPVGTNRLQRSLGVWFGIAVGVGGMIGAGILRAPADVATRLPSPFLFLGAWVLGGIYALLGANALAELATIRPRSGGQYVFVREALGPYAGFIVGWNDWISSSASVAAVAIVESEAIAGLMPSLAGQVLLLALVGVVITTIVLVRGIRESDRAQRLTSAIKALALLALIVACLSWRASNRMPASTAVTPLPIPTGLALLAAMAAALQGVIFAYDGWTGIVYYSGEVMDPGREIPRALAGGLVSTIVLYLLINAAFLAVLQLPGIAASPLAAAGAASVVFGSSGGTIVQIIIALALPSALVANALNASRVIFAMGEDRIAPAWCARVNRGGTPQPALLVTSVVAALFLLTGTFERLIAICTFLFVASYALSFVSVFVLRRREPDVPRPYRAWGHPWSTGAVLLGSLAFLGATLAADPRNAAIVAALLVLSYPAFRIVTRRRA